MSVLPLASPRRVVAQSGPASSYALASIESFGRPEACERIWRRLQDNGVSTPFQRFDWVAAYLRTRSAVDRETRIVLVRNGGGDPTMLLPLDIEMRLGTRIATIVGGKQANYKMPILAHGADLTPEAIRDCLLRAGHELDIDAYQFLGTPLSWNGVDNPLAAAGRQSPSDAFSLALSADGNETLSGALDRGARKKLRQKEKWLARLGAVAHLEPVDAHGIDLVLDAFFAQKSARLKARGLPDPFARDHVRRFLREACRRGPKGAPPAIELHALTLDGRPVAVFAGAADRDRLSGMVISFDESDEIARCSPGDLLIARVIEAQCARGRSVFDLGVGEARYKRSFCRNLDALADTVIPVTESGRLYASATRLATDAKRFVKQTTWTMRLVTAMRRGTALLT